MENSQEIKKIELGDDTLRNLNITRKWTMFLAITGFIFLGLIIALGLITGTFLSAFNNSEKIAGIPDILLLAVFFGVAVIYFFPVFFLFRFSKHTSAALSSLDRQELHKALKYLKYYFAYIGIILIAGISLYIAGLIVAGTTGVFFKGL